MRVKGRAQPTRIYTLFDALGGERRSRDRILPIHSAMLAAYRRKDWDGAEAAIAACEALGVAGPRGALRHLPRAHRRMAGEPAAGGLGWHVYRDLEISRPAVTTVTSGNRIAGHNLGPAGAETETGGLNVQDAVTALIAVLIVLQIKHFVFDYPLQTLYMLRNKGTYGHPGGILHSGLHALGTIVAFFVMTPTLLLGVAIMIGEFVVHYHVDWSKEQSSVAWAVPRPSANSGGRSAPTSSSTISPTSRSRRSW